MNDTIYVRNRRLNPSQLDELSRQFLTQVSRPVRSKIIYSGLQRDDLVVEECHRQRIMWLVDQLKVLMPDLVPTIDSLPYTTLAEAQGSLNDLNNTTYDVSDNILVLKHILTWELQMTEEMHRYGIFPEEIPSVVACQEMIRERNRDFAKRVSSETYRLSTSLAEKRRDIAKHEESIRTMMIPLVQVLSLRVGDLSSRVLLKFMKQGNTLSSPSSKKSAIECLKRDLVVKAREPAASGRPFVIKDYLV